MRLGGWRSVWLEYDFDRKTGRWTRRIVKARPDRPVCGFGAVERTREHGALFFCLYRWGDRQVFQAGARSWWLDGADLKFTFRGGRTRSEFGVHEEGAVTFRCSYGNRIRTAMALVNTTHDDLDYENDHFLLRVGTLSLPAAAPEAWIDGKGA